MLFLMRGPKMEFFIQRLHWSSNIFHIIMFIFFTCLYRNWSSQHLTEEVILASSHTKSFQQFHPSPCCNGSESYHPRRQKQPHHHPLLCSSSIFFLNFVNLFPGSLSPTSYILYYNTNYTHSSVYQEASSLLVIISRYSYTSIYIIQQQIANVHTKILQRHASQFSRCLLFSAHTHKGTHSLRICSVSWKVKSKDALQKKNRT